MSSPRHASARFIAVVGLLVLSALDSGQPLQAQQPINGYYEFSGMWWGNYALDPGRARAAVLAALAALHMPVYQEGFYLYGSFLDTRTTDNYEARLTIQPLAPASAGTRIGVRIGGFGTHRQVCARILDEIARHLEAARRGPPAPGVVLVPGPAGMTGPPPLVILRPPVTVSLPPPPAPPPPPIPAK